MPSDPIARLISAVLSSIKQDIIEVVSSALSSVVDESTVTTIANGIARGLRSLLLMSYKSSVGDKSSDAYHMFGSGLGSDLMKFVGSAFKSKLTSMIADVLGGELKQYAKGISTDVYRLLLNAIKAKSGGSVQKRPKPQMDKRATRGQLVSKLMKEQGLSLGQASKEASRIMNN